MTTFTTLKFLALTSLASVLLIFANESNAAYVCSGKLDALAQPWEGSINITSAQIYGDNTARTVCNLKLVWNGVDPVVCKGWLAALLSAKVMGSTISVQYNDATSACSQQQAYGNAGAPWAIW